MPVLGASLRRGGTSPTIVVEPGGGVPGRTARMGEAGRVGSARRRVGTPGPDQHGAGRPGRAGPGAGVRYPAAELDLAPLVRRADALVAAGAADRVGLLAWLAGLLGLLALAMLIQGPRKALAQFLDLPGHARLLSAALARLRRASRLVAALFGAAVISWTCWQTYHYGDPERLEELAATLKSKSVGEVAVEQASFAALTPTRDLLDLGDCLVLTVAAGILVFRLSAERWGNVEGSSAQGAVPAGTTLCWGAVWLYMLYRVASVVVENTKSTLLLGGCLPFEAAVVPLLMLAADALLLSWALVELRGKYPAATDSVEGFDVAGAVARMPAAALACLLAVPGRYLASAAWLAQPWLPAAWTAKLGLSTLLRGWGLVGVQVLALSVAGIAGVVPWTRGSMAGALGGYARLLRLEGGRLVGLLALAGAAAGALAWAAYAAVLSLPAQALGPGRGRRLRPLRHAARRPRGPLGAGRTRRPRRARARTSRRRAPGGRDLRGRAARLRRIDRLTTTSRTPCT